MEDYRKGLAPALFGYVRPGEIGAGDLTWWTFAGGRINTTIKFILDEIYGWKVPIDNLRLRLEGERMAVSMGHWRI